MAVGRGNTQFVLNIKDLSKLKILKVKDWAIDFDYDGIRYLLHGGSEMGEGSWQDLYIKRLDGYGRYDLELIKTVHYIDEYVGNYYFGGYDKNGLTYSQLDLVYFVKLMTWNGLVKSLYSSEINKIKRSIKLKEDNIQTLRAKEIKLQKEISELKIDFFKR